MSQSASDSPSADFETLFEHSGEGIFLLDAAGRFMRINRAFTGLLGYAPQDICGRAFMDVAGDIDRIDERYRDSIARYQFYYCDLAEKQPIQIFFRQKNGERLQFRLHSVLLRSADGAVLQRVGFISKLIDLADLNVPDRNLLQAWELEQNYKSILDHSGDAIIISDLNGRVVTVNAAALQLLDVPSAEMLVGKHLLELGPYEGTHPCTTGEAVTIDESWREAQVGYTDRMFETGNAQCELYLFKSDATVVPVAATLSLLKDPRGEHRGSICICRDITQWLKSQHAITATRDFLENVINTTGDGIYVTDEMGYIITINDALCRMTGYGREEILGLYGPTLLPDAMSAEDVQIAYDSLFHRHSATNFVYIWKKKDGSTFPAETRLTTLEDREGNAIGLVASVRDITDRRYMQARLQQAQKMETVGTLAAGIAHNFNNILQSMVGFTELAAGMLPTGSPARAHLEQTLLACDRATDLVEQIQQFCRQTAVGIAPVPLSTVLRAAIKIIRSTIPTSIEIRQYIDCPADTVNADVAQFQQMLLNLCVNAQQAVAETGLIEIRLENVTLTEEDVKLKRLKSKAGSCVQLSIRDNGRGMDKELVKRVFEPFFTTKGIAQHTGLGLSVTKGIIDRHGGDITVESRPGAGTLFTVLFPVVEDGAEKAGR